MQDIEELMQLAADGAASAEQMSALQRMLAVSPEARDKYAALQDLVRQLDSVPMVDGPGSRQIWERTPRPLARFRRDRKRSSRRWFAIGYAAAAVLVIAIAVHETTVPTHSSSASMQQIEQWPVVGQAASDVATIVVRSDGDEVIAQVTTRLPWTIEYDKTALQKLEPGHFRRIGGTKRFTVITLRLPNNQELKAAVDLR